MSSGTGCTQCSCHTFHAHLFLKTKCLSCPHPLSAHAGGDGAPVAAVSAPGPTRATRALSAATASFPPPPPPPPPATNNDGGDEPPPPPPEEDSFSSSSPQRKPMPPRVPSSARSSNADLHPPPPPPPPPSAASSSVSPPSVSPEAAAAASAALLAALPRPPPRASISGPAGGMGGGSLLQSGQYPARAPPPGPGLASGQYPARPLPSGQFPPARPAPAAIASNANGVKPPSNNSNLSNSAPMTTGGGASGGVTSPPPPPPATALHVRTDSANGGGGSLGGDFVPSPTTAASLSALLSSPSPPSDNNRTINTTNARSQPHALRATSSGASATAAVNAASAAGGGLLSPSSGAPKQEWVDPNYKPNFALKIPHKFDVVVQQSHAGMYLLKRVRAFLRSFASLQERYASELVKITSLERSKLAANAAASASTDAMPSCQAAWQGFFNGMDQLAQANQVFAQDLKEATLEQLEKFYGIGIAMVKEHQVEQTRVHSAMLKVNVSVAKDREAASQALQKLAVKRGEELVGAAPVPSAASASSSSSALDASKKGVGALSLFKHAPSKAGFEKSKESAIRVCEHYASALTTANVAHHRYHAEELPNMMTQMQSLEEMRLHSLHAALRDFSKLQKGLTSAMLNITHSIEELASNMNGHADISAFVKQVCDEHGPALPPVPFSYDLPISLAELRAMPFDEPPSSLFYSTLDGVMKQQKAMESQLGTTANTVAQAGAAVGGGGGMGGIGMDGTADTSGGMTSTLSRSLELPLIVPTLLRNIYESDGCHSEGIFRLSVGSEELTRLRRQLESGDMSLKLAQPNPHVSACLLKSWFRDLLVPVFPYALYEKCIALGQKDNWSASDPACAAAMKALLSSELLPPLNAKILALLFGFLKKLATQPDYVACTRMNLANIGLVFSPGLVRSEKNDPLQMLTDTKYASLFTSRAIESYPASFPPEAQECAQQMLDEIFASNVVVTNVPTATAT